MNKIKPACRKPFILISGLVLIIALQNTPGVNLCCCKVAQVLTRLDIHQLSLVQADHIAKYSCVGTDTCYFISINPVFIAKRLKSDLLFAPKLSQNLSL